MDSLLQSLILSASLGALMGLIRQWADQHESEAFTPLAGLRTFILWALVGFLAAFISAPERPLPLLVALILVVSHVIVLSGRAQNNQSVGLTTAAAAIITVLVGALACWEYWLLAVILSAVTMIVLGIKQISHSWTRRFTEEDIRSTLQFVAVSGVVLPLVPNQGYGPYEAINPYSLWLMVVLISGLGFVGYLLMRWLGTRAGVALTGLVGGLASSTATTLAFGRESTVYPELSKSFALAIVMACTIMLGRVLIILVLIHPPVLAPLWFPFLVMASPGILYVLGIQFFRGSSRRTVEIPNLKNPLGLGIAIKFGLLYGVITFLVRVFSEADLTNGLLALSFLSGLTDMDAIALSITQDLRVSGVPIHLASQAIIVAAIANTLLKAGLVLSIGSPELKRHVSIALGSTALAGTLCFFLIP